MQVSRAGMMTATRPISSPVILKQRQGYKSHPKSVQKNPNNKPGTDLGTNIPKPAQSKSGPSDWSLNELLGWWAAGVGRGLGEADQGNYSPVLPWGLTTNHPLILPISLLNLLILSLLSTWVWTVSEACTRLDRLLVLPRVALLKWSDFLFIALCIVCISVSIPVQKEMHNCILGSYSTCTYA